MTTIDTRPEAVDTADVDDASSGVVRFFATAGEWIMTTDHKRIGRIYAGAGLVVAAAVAVLGIVLGLERAGSGELVDGGAVLQLIQTYRVALVFGAAIPLALGLSIAIAPLQCGARQIAFPRVALTGCYAWLGGFVLTIASLIDNGGIGGGNPQAVDTYLVGLGLMVLGTCASAGTVVTTIMTTRAPGMTMWRLPMFSWSALVGSLGILLALPVQFGVIIYLFVDHRLGAQFNFGGTEGLAAWIGWAFSVPAVVVYSLPAIGLAAELVPVAFKARQPMRGTVFAGIALVGVTALAATTQQFALTVTLDAPGQTVVEGAVPVLLFGGLPLLGLLIVMALGALTAKHGAANGRPRISGPFLFGFFGLGMVFVGLIGNLAQSITDLELLGTTVEEGATLYVVYGTLLGVLGGLIFWAPKLWGRTIGEAKSIPLALLGVAGVVLAALPLYIAGVLDQPGGIPADDAQVAAMLSTDGVSAGPLWMFLSLAGHALVLLTVVATIGVLLQAVRSDEVADDNPYGAHTIEWSTPSPTPRYNYEHVATVTSAEPLFDPTPEGSPS